MVLSSAEIKQYRQKGFLVRKRLVSPDAVAKVAENFENIEDLDPEKAQPSFYYEPSVTQAGKKLLRRIERVSDHSTLAKDLILSSEILSAVDELTGETPILFKDKLNLKLPGGAGFRPHVDGHFYWTDFRGTKRKGWAEYGSYFTTVVLPLDSSRVENGCLEVSPLDEALEIFGRSWCPICRLSQARTIVTPTVSALCPSATDANGPSVANAFIDHLPFHAYRHQSQPAIQ